MAKILNVDGLAKERKEIVLKGVTHEIKEMSVDDFLVAMNTADVLDKDSSPKAQIDAIVTMVSRAIPTLQEAEIRGLPFEQLNAISAFIRGEVPDEIKNAVTEAQVSGN
jgi:hypothetical protein